MASIYRHGKKWRAEVRLKGIYDSITRPTKLEAQAWAIQREAEILEGSFSRVDKKYTLADALLRYAETVSVKRKGERWEKIKINAFLTRLPFVNDLLIDVSSEQIAEWRDQRLNEVKPDTVRRELTILNSVFEIARKEWKWIKNNPKKDVKNPPRTKGRDRLITLDEIEPLLVALNYQEGEPPRYLKQEIAYLFLLALETAMRNGELLSLTYDSIFLDKRFVHLDKTKNGDTRDVPLSLRAINLIEMLSKNRNENNKLFRVNAGSADAMFRIAKKAAVIDDLHFHDSRHEATTRLAKKLSVLDLARVTGHRDPRSLMVYYNESAEKIAELLD